MQITDGCSSKFTLKCYWKELVRVNLDDNFRLENLFGFMPKRSATNAVYLLQVLMYVSAQKETKDPHMVFMEIGIDRKSLCWGTTIFMGRL